MPPVVSRAFPPPRVSVVLPVRDGAATLDAALASLQAQTLPAWEAVVVDDGSTDDTPRRLADWAARDPRIRPTSAPRRGLVAALNHGLTVARAPCIARLDADDTAHPERLAAQAGWLEQHPGLGLVSCLVEFGGSRETAAGYARYVDWLNTVVTPEAIALQRFIESPLAHPSVMFRRELVDRHGAYAEGEFPEDYELWLRWLEAGVRMAKVPRSLLTWNDPPRRLSRTDPRYAPVAFYECKARYLARWLGGGPLARRPLWVWGAGRLTRRRVERLQAAGITVAAFIDIDVRKIGRFHGTAPVLGVESLPPPGEVFVLGYVSAWGARELIRAALTRRGYVEGDDFLMAA